MEHQISKNISLPIQEEPNEFVPHDLPYEGNKILLEQIALAINLNRPVLLVGETGTGKTSVVRHLATKTQNGFRRLNLNGGTGTDELLGKMLLNKDGTYWINGVLIDSMEKGHWVLLDEINAASAEVLFALHSLLDDDGYIVLAENNGEIVRPHKNFRLFATMNPAQDYTGTRDMNKALMSRFMVVKTDFPSPMVEAKIMKMRTKIQKDIATRMIGFAGELRAMYKAGKTTFVLSTRELLQWAELFLFYNKYLPSAELAILNKVSEDDFSSVKDLLTLHFSKFDNPGKKEIEEDDKIKVGCLVEVTDDSNYKLSGKGSQGKVISISEEKATIEFTKLKSDKEQYPGTFPVTFIIDIEDLKRI